MFKNMSNSFDLSVVPRFSKNRSGKGFPPRKRRVKYFVMMRLFSHFVFFAQHLVWKEKKSNDRERGKKYRMRCSNCPLFGTFFFQVAFVFFRTKNKHLCVWKEVTMERHAIYIQRRLTPSPPHPFYRDASGCGCGCLGNHFLLDMFSGIMNSILSLEISRPTFSSYFLCHNLDTLSFKRTYWTLEVFPPQ